MFFLVLFRCIITSLNIIFGVYRGQVNKMLSCWPIVPMSIYVHSNLINHTNLNNK